MLGIAVIAIAVVVVGRDPAHRRHPDGLGPRLGAAGRRLAGGRRGAGGAAGGAVGRARARRAADGAAAGDREEARRRSRRSGSASVICSDKTGTLTKNEMTIEKVVTGSGEVDVTGSGYRPEGELRVDGRPLDDPVLLDEVRAVLAAGSLANDAVLREERRRVDDPGRSHRGRVPGRRGEGRGAAPRRASARFERVGEVPFTSERKLMSTLQSDARASSVLPSSPRARPTCCSPAAPQERVGGAVRPLTEARRSEILATRRAARRPRAAHARRRLPAAAAGRAPAGRTSRSSASWSTSGWSGSSTRRARRRGRRSPTRTPPASAC